MEHQPEVSTIEGGWKAEARKLLERGVRFSVVNLTEEALGTCIGLAQEFDFFLVQQVEEGCSYPQLPARLEMVPKRL